MCVYLYDRDREEKDKKTQNDPKSTIFDLQLQRSYPIIVCFFRLIIIKNDNRDQ